MSATPTHGMESSARNGFLPDLRQRDQYGFALLLIIATIVVRAIAGDNPLGQLGGVALGGGTVVFVLYTADAHPRVLRPTEVFTVVAIAASLLALLTGTDKFGPLVTTIFGLLLALVAPVAIAARLRSLPKITFRTVLGALCIYLLLGLFFSYVFGLAASIDRVPFFVEPDAGSATDYVYFSYVTITTTGYGDYTAATDLGRMLAITEALTGQLYLVSVVALLVGNIGREVEPRRRGRSVSADAGVAAVDDDGMAAADGPDASTGSDPAAGPDAAGATPSA
ncbi:MAG: potassium channel family protein [Chloroflexota bacterium]